MTKAGELSSPFLIWYLKSHPTQDPFSKMRIITASFKPESFDPTGSVNPLSHKQWQVWAHRILQMEEILDLIQLSLYWWGHFRVWEGKKLAPRHMSSISPWLIVLTCCFGGHLNYWVELLSFLETSVCPTVTFRVTWSDPNLNVGWKREDLVKTKTLPIKSQSSLEDGLGMGHILFYPQWRGYPFHILNLWFQFGCDKGFHLSEPPSPQESLLFLKVSGDNLANITEHLF